MAGASKLFEKLFATKLFAVSRLCSMFNYSLRMMFLALFRKCIPLFLYCFRLLRVGRMNCCGWMNYSSFRLFFVDFRMLFFAFLLVFCFGIDGWLLYALDSMC